MPMSDNDEGTFEKNKTPTGNGVKVGIHEHRLDIIESRLQRTEDSIEGIKADVTAIKTELKSLATKTDVTAIETELKSVATKYVVALWVSAVGLFNFLALLGHLLIRSLGSG